MGKSEALARLRARESDLRAMGIARLALFGSTARGDETPLSDVDLAVTFPAGALLQIGAFGYVDIIETLGTILGAPVDLVTEPSRKPRLQAEIDRDRVDVF